MTKGTIVVLDDNTRFEVLEIGPRESFADRGLEPHGVTLLGQGIVGLNLETGKKEYFYDFDVWKVEGREGTP